MVYGIKIMCGIVLKFWLIDFATIYGEVKPVLKWIYLFFAAAAAVDSVENVNLKFAILYST